MEYFIILPSLFASILIVWGIYELVFYLTHKHPLSTDEVLLYAKQKRIVSINNYYKFRQVELIPNSSFKSNMSPYGQLYPFNCPINNAPAYISSLLKWKKHEWIILAFERNGTIVNIFTNKGQNSTSVSLMWSYDDIISFSNKNNISTILHFHNHPNSNPNLYNCTTPSETDKNSAEAFWSKINHFGKGINLFEFVCERGSFYQYHSRISDNFLPYTLYLADIQARNGISQKENYHLHRELRMIKHKHIHV